MMAKYNDGKKLPAVPKAPMQIIKVPEFKFSEYKPLSYGIGKEKESKAPQSFEDMDMGTRFLLTGRFCLAEPGGL